MHTLQIGHIRIRAVQAGRLRLDGGAMFGIIPKPHWSKRMPPDKLNRIGMAMWCFLVEVDGERSLIETGFGGKVSERLREIHALEEVPGLLPSLRQIGTEPGEVDRVILSHLHQDHAGGSTIGTAGAYAPTFPNARYIIQEGEWKDAREADGQSVNAYPRESVMDPLETAAVVDYVNGEAAFGPIRLFQTPGHTRTHQSVLIESGGETFFYTGDLVPTTHHLRPLYVMAFDHYPRETFLNKQKWLGQAAEGDWWVATPHDPDLPWIRIKRDAREEFVARSD
jgi:glyoxylase-like metal-dependent hydrolase (beta-lactamase superfamily II)